MRRTLLFIHGAGTHDLEGDWATTVDAACRRLGAPTPEARGFDYVAPSYLDLQDRRFDEIADTTEPDYTYRRADGSQHEAAAGRYFRARGRLEAALKPAINGEASRLPPLPADQLARPIMTRVFPGAKRYCDEEKRRFAIIHRVLEAIPGDGELVMIGHSLGSLVAADLLYYLPPSVRLRLLITIGSPIGLKELRRHLKVLAKRFPFERTGPWLNVLGAADPVCSRPASEVIPEVHDAWIDTGTPPDNSHAPQRYLDHEVLAQALDWIGRDEDRIRPGTDLDRPPSEQVLAVVASAQYALRLEQSMKAGERRTRFSQARQACAEEWARSAMEGGEDHGVLRRLDLDNTRFLDGRFTQLEAAQLLLMALMTKLPLAPFEIKVDSDVRDEALRSLAVDIGFAPPYAKEAIDAESRARKAQKEGVSPRRVALGAAGAAVLIAAPYAVLAAAPAGLAGGAAIVAGLATIGGPAGMLGGLALVGGMGSVGGAAMARSLIGGSTAQVEENVVALNALRIARYRLKIEWEGSPEYFHLVQMLSALNEDHARLARFSDSRSSALKAVRTKLTCVRRALRDLDKAGLGAPRLEAKN